MCQEGGRSESGREFVSGECVRRGSEGEGVHQEGSGSESVREGVSHGGSVSGRE